MQYLQMRYNEGIIFFMHNFCNSDQQTAKNHKTLFEALKFSCKTCQRHNHTDKMHLEFSSQLPVWVPFGLM